jgi:GNAT superfamily N-acetyltransferase
VHFVSPGYDHLMKGGAQAVMAVGKYVQYPVQSRALPDHGSGQPRQSRFVVHVLSWREMPDSQPDYRIRPAEPRDVPVIAHHRAAMFRDMGSIPQQDYELLRQASVDWIAGLFTVGGYAGWLVDHQDIVVAGGGILLREMGPLPGSYHPNRWAHIVNVYSEPGHRRRGLARQVMQTMLDWCADRSFDLVTLAASDEGRPLYKSLGFVPTNDMRLLKRP